MLSGLYKDLPQAKDAEPAGTSSGWAASKKATTVFGPPPSVLRAGRGVSGPGRGRGRGDASSAGRGGAAVAPARLPAAPGLAMLGGDVEDEYDPARPNDYDDVVKERERLRKDAEMEELRQQRLKEAEKTREADLAREERDREWEREREEARARDRESGATPADRDAALNVSGDEAFARRGRLGRQSGFSDGAAEAPAGPLGMGLAARMMEKMGWKEGQGLGRNQQGIATPLIAKKTDQRSGRIVVADALPAADSGPPEKRLKVQGATISGRPTKVILLRNMVGPGEVDEALEDEVGMECSKYGKVTRVLIFEVTEPGYQEEEAVRIFVEFERIEQATKAVIDLGGRFFGGRTVRSGFFNEDKFDRNELAPMPNEFN